MEKENVTETCGGTSDVTLLQLKPLGKFTQTWTPERNPVPVILIVACEPLATLAGLTEAIVGIGLGTVIEKGTELEGPPPGGGLETLTWTVPGTANAEAGRVASSRSWPLPNDPGAGW